MYSCIYLAAGRATHNCDGISFVYQDILGNRDIGGDMLDINLNDYDIIIATPPCNYWSRARGKKISNYSIITKDLLPNILDKLIYLNKPFIVENVRNYNRFKDNGIFDKNCFVYFYGRHTYFTNIPFDPNGLNQIQDFKNHGYVVNKIDGNYHQGGFNVKTVIDYWLSIVKNYLINSNII